MGQPGGRNSTVALGGGGAKGCQGQRRAPPCRRERAVCRPRAVGGCCGFEFGKSRQGQAWRPRRPCPGTWTLGSLLCCVCLPGGGWGPPELPPRAHREEAEMVTRGDAVSSPGGAGAPQAHLRRWRWPCLGAAATKVLGGWGQGPAGRPGGAWRQSLRLGHTCQPERAWGEGPRECSEHTGRLTSGVPKALRGRAVAWNLDGPHGSRGDQGEQVSVLIRPHGLHGQGAGAGRGPRRRQGPRPAATHTRCSLPTPGLASWDSTGRCAHPKGPRSGLDVLTSSHLEGRGAISRLSRG